MEPSDWEIEAIDTGDLHTRPVFRDPDHNLEAEALVEDTEHRVSGTLRALRDEDMVSMALACLDHAATSKHALRRMVRAIRQELDIPQDWEDWLEVRR